jgi:predicted nucleic acid-binding protein
LDYLYIPPEDRWNEKALFYVEEYFLSHSMQLADALIGATCATYGMTLYTANDKHYKVIKGLDIFVFRP